MQDDINQEITFRKLSVFMMFMAKGNIARTAEAMKLSSVSVHRALHSLEEGVGCPLFVHKGRNLLPLQSPKPAPRPPPAARAPPASRWRPRQRPPSLRCSNTLTHIEGSPYDPSQNPGRALHGRLCPRGGRPGAAAPAGWSPLTVT